MCPCCGSWISHICCWLPEPSSHQSPPRPITDQSDGPAGWQQEPNPLQLGAVSSSPNNLPALYSSPIDQNETILHQQLPPAAHQSQTVPWPESPSPNSPTSRHLEHNLIHSSASTSREFQPPRRIDSIFREAKVVLVTRCNDRPRRRETLTLPTGQTPEKTYKYIEGTAKRVETAKRIDGQEDYPNDQKLCFDEGTCKIICVKHKAKVKGKCGFAEEHPLESHADWTEIEALLQNYESIHAGHGSLIVVIKRKLKTMGDSEGSRRTHRNLLHFNLKQQMVKVEVEGGRNQKYMPNDIMMENFMKQNTIRGLINEEINSLGVMDDDRHRITEQILHEAPILLLIFVYSRMELRFLKTLLEHGIGDEALPIPEEHPPWLPKGQDIRDFEDINDYDTLRQSQWPFQAVVFDRVFDEHRILDPDAIIPFRRKEVRGSGAFSVVYKIELEASHQRLYKLPGVPNPELALKAVRVHPTTAAASANERLLLKGLRDLGHDHIIKLLASYEQDGAYYFIFPLADFSLEELMRMDPDGLDNPDSVKHRRYVAWIMGQFAGIASGLAEVHKRSTGSNATGSSKPPTAELLDPNVAVARDRRPLGTTGYHHDIKPQNLLYFRVVADTANPCPEHGILQLADFGIGKFHSLQSGTGTKTVRGTPTYAAPESKIPSATPSGKNAKPELKLSRPYDVWSLGCVMLEVLVWLVYGTKGWQEFNSERVGLVEESDPFPTDGFFYLYNAPNRRARVRDSVTLWMKKLEENPRLKNNPNGSLTGLLALIKTDVLVVDPIERIKTKRLTDELDKLAKTAYIEAGGNVTLTHHSSYNEDGTDSLSSGGTPAVTLEYDAPESATTPSSGSAPQKRSITELIKSRPGSPAKQELGNSYSRSSLPVRGPIQASDSPRIPSTPPRVHNPKPPSRTSTGMTNISGLSTIVEPTTTRTDYETEYGS